MNVSNWINQANQEIAKLDINAVKDSGILPARGRNFFPVIGYPPLTMYNEMDQKPMFEGIHTRPTNPTIAYVHIPFCPSRCTFCHWITKTKSKSDEVDVYLDYLDKEMSIYKQNMGLDTIPVKSVLIGGGTPTYPSAKQLERFLDSFTRHFDLSECTQFSVEAEPRTLLGKAGFERLRVLKDYGVDRISMGVQSFDDQILKYMGRAHNNQDTLDSIKQMRQARIENIFIDLIYAYPNQSMESWVENMLTAVSLDIEGYQLYRLRIKQHGDRQGNILTQANKNPDKFASTDKIMLMKYLGIMISKHHGYNEYQTRVFARREEDISHYLRDWAADLMDVVGVGVSAWSNLRGVFSMNVGDQDLSTYYNIIEHDKVAINRGKIRTQDDEFRRSFILPLKNRSVNKDLFRQRTGKTVYECFKNEIEWLKSLHMFDEDDKKIWLTERGRFFADEVSTQFFNPNFLPFDDIKLAPPTTITNT